MQPSEKKTCSICSEEKEISKGNICKDCRDQFNRIAKYGWDHRDDQDLYEVSNTQDWAKEMNKRGHSIPIPEIKANPNDPPDVFAEMDGNRIAIEVTRLVKYVDQDKVIVSSSTKHTCLLYTSPSPRDRTRSRMPSSA